MDTGRGAVVSSSRYGAGSAQAAAWDRVAASASGRAPRFSRETRCFGR